MSNDHDIPDWLPEIARIDLADLIDFLYREYPRRNSDAYRNMINELIIKNGDHNRIGSDIKQISLHYGWKFYIDYMVAILAYGEATGGPKARNAYGALAIQPYLDNRASDEVLLQTTVDISNEDDAPFTEILEVGERVNEVSNEWAPIIQQAATAVITSHHRAWAILAKAPGARDQLSAYTAAVLLHAGVIALCTPVYTALRAYLDGTMDMTDWSPTQVAKLEELARKMGLM